MKILILGGDGFCGWPTALHLSARGHDITIVDNFSRRRIDIELGVQSLTPIRELTTRLRRWRMETGTVIGLDMIDIALEIERLYTLIAEWKPNAIIHFAEQRAAPFSMKTMGHKRYTVNNNVNATHNLLAVMAELKSTAHLVHLGTMGVYGYGAVDGEILPEGYLTVDYAWPTDQGGVMRAQREIRYPSSPGSVYHMTKCLDAEMFAYYAKNDRLRITDLHQGIVWGTLTDETSRHEELINRFDYDGDYGTVLNRFIVQAALGYPLTVHGTGEQTRAFIHIRDSVKCIELALASPPSAGDRVRIFNQMTETHRIIDLATGVSGAFGVEMNHVDNPRNEAARNNLRVSNQSFLDLGLSPTFLSYGLIDEVHDVAERYRDRIDRSKIPSTSRWVK